MKDKVVVITGASRGFGKSLAQAFAEEQARVVISSRDNEELRSTAQEIGHGVMAIPADVTKENEVEYLAKKVIEEYKRIDIWINNAGIWLPKTTFQDIDMARARQLFDVNVFGTIYGSKAAVMQMKKQDKGIIVNIISTSALKGRPEISVYSASKHAESGFSDSIREELRNTAIKVIGVYPGGMKTHLFDEDKPVDFDQYLSPETVAGQIIDNLKKENPEEKQIIKRPGQP